MPLPPIDEGELLMIYLHPPRYKCKVRLLDITLISAPLNFQNILEREKCVLRFLIVFHLHAHLASYDAPASYSLA